MVIKRFRQTTHKYPRQFWLMFWGMMISTTGASMIWPFLMIYVTERLNLPLTSAASLLTLNAFVGLVASFLAGPMIDRVGRKWMMVASLLLNGLNYVFLSQAHTYPEFALLLGLSGVVNPVYRVGADAMIADLVPPGDRIEAYALLRLSNNMGVAIGPALGGIIASRSYNIAFFFAAAGMITYSMLLAIYAHETLPSLSERSSQATPMREKWGGYPAILRDFPFISVVLVFSLVSVCSVIIWVLLPVYAKTNYQVPENLYGLIPTTNAIMVVTMQLAVTKITKRYPPLIMMALGAFFYAAGAGSISLGQGFWGFWLSMVIMTIGELVIVPTSSTYAANLAPPDKRGRYMSLYGLTWGIAAGIGPILGGFLNDTFGPQATWYGAFLIGMIATVGFMYLAKILPNLQPIASHIDSAR